MNKGSPAFNAPTRVGVTESARKKTGRSTAAEVLAQTGNPIAAQVLRWRELTKLKTTYLDGLAKLTGADGRVHTKFNQTVTATGRLSSSEPNLQNIPVRTAEGKAIRSLFVPGEGFDLIMTADYSQIELRIMAHLSGEANLIAAFAAGEDIHSKTAQELGINRRAAKAVNFGIIYGLSDYGLAQELKISRQAAADFINRYFDKNPAVKTYLDETIKAAHRTGYVTTLYGRRRAAEGIKAANHTERAAAERIAMNTPIQGTAADIMKRAMLRAEDALRGMTSRIIMQVHDELIMEVTAAEAAAVAEKIREAMEGAADLSVPLPVKIKIDKSW